MFRLIRKIKRKMFWCMEKFIIFSFQKKKGTFSLSFPPQTRLLQTMTVGFCMVTEKLLVKNVNPNSISNQKKPDPSKISQEELPDRPAEMEATPPNIAHSDQSSGSFTFCMTFVNFLRHFLAFVSSQNLTEKKTPTFLTRSSCTSNAHVHR